METGIKLFGYSPNWWIGSAGTILAAVVAFSKHAGVDIPQGIQDAILSLVPIAVAMFLGSQVTPVNKLVDNGVNPVTAKVEDKVKQNAPPKE